MWPFHQVIFPEPHSGGTSFPPFSPLLLHIQEFSFPFFSHSPWSFPVFSGFHLIFPGFPLFLPIFIHFHYFLSFFLVFHRFPLFSPLFTILFHSSPLFSLVFHPLPPFFPSVFHFFPIFHFFPLVFKCSPHLLIFPLFFPCFSLYSPVFPCFLLFCFSSPISFGFPRFPLMSPIFPCFLLCFSIFFCCFFPPFAFGFIFLFSFVFFFPPLSFVCFFSPPFSFFFFSSFIFSFFFHFPTFPPFSPRFPLFSPSYPVQDVTPRSTLTCQIPALSFPHPPPHPTEDNLPLAGLVAAFRRDTSIYPAALRTQRCSAQKQHRCWLPPPLCPTGDQIRGSFTRDPNSALSAVLPFHPTQCRAALRSDPLLPHCRPSSPSGPAVRVEDSRSVFLSCSPLPGHPCHQWWRPRDERRGVHQPRLQQNRCERGR